jgi:hypothetical protein
VKVSANRFRLKEGPPHKNFNIDIETAHEPFQTRLSEEELVAGFWLQFTVIENVSMSRSVNVPGGH